MEIKIALIIVNPKQIFKAKQPPKLVKQKNFTSILQFIFIIKNKIKKINNNCKEKIIIFSLCSIIYNKKIINCIK